MVSKTLLILGIALIVSGIYLLTNYTDTDGLVPEIVSFSIGLGYATLAGGTFFIIIGFKTKTSD